jgi:hypothetical protein
VADSYLEVATMAEAVGVKVVPFNVFISNYELCNGISRFE